jgi:uncharacterized membrane protein YsdA (DUF1294 family)
LIFIASISFIAFVLYLADKIKAKKRAWRIPERVLLGIGFFGGAIGALIAMQLFRHKTKHAYFYLVNVLGLVLQTALAYLIIKYS